MKIILKYFRRLSVFLFLVASLSSVNALEPSTQIEVQTNAPMLEFHYGNQIGNLDLTITYDGNITGRRWIHFKTNEFSAQLPSDQLASLKSLIEKSSGGALKSASGTPTTYGSPSGYIRVRSHLTEPWRIIRSVERAPKATDPDLVNFLVDSHIRAPIENIVHSLLQSGDAWFYRAPLVDGPSTDESALTRDDVKRPADAPVWLTRHDIKVPDRQQWLEDAESPAVKKWLRFQEQETKKYFSSLNSEAMKKRLTELFDIPSRENTKKIGNHWYYLQRRKGEGFPKLVRTEKEPADIDENAQIIFDPHQLDEHDRVFISSYSESPDKKIIAIGLSFAGSDWRQWKFLNLEDLTFLPDQLERTKFDNIVWSKDSKSIFYSQYSSGKANFGLGIFVHELGAPQNKDRLVYKNEGDPQTHYSIQYAYDGSYQFMIAGGQKESKILYRETSDDNPWIELKVVDQSAYTSAGESDGKVLFISTEGSPRGRLIGVDLRGPSPTFLDLIPESDETLISFRQLGDFYIGGYLKDARLKVRFFSKNFQAIYTNVTGKLWELGPTTLDAFKMGEDKNTLTFRQASYIKPPTLSSIDLKTLEIKKQTIQNLGIIPMNSDDFVSRQVFYLSKDGTKIPMTVSHKKGIALDRKNPTWLYAYGGFKTNMLPSFDPSYIAFMEEGGIVAVPNIRGGGEYGDDWNVAAQKIHRNKAFEDFEEAAKWLVSEGYADKIGIHGASNGGLLVGAVLVRRPELFGAAIPEVGVHNLIKFPEYTVGWGWQDEYGDPETRVDDFHHLLGYSPVHQAELRGGQNYPATLVMTASNDDRVAFQHSYQFAEALKDAQTGSAPILLRVQDFGGHSRKSITIQKQIEAATLRCTFLLKNLAGL
ncbi:MAG: prolyl oligopeptidase Serine peptidase family [Bacteriovoracaceae bacterium]|nr:prolyl oligopeptidase Serine peptidase family [Bacteriovoracaceae bacterium]